MRKETRQEAAEEVIQCLLTNVERRDRVLRALAPLCGGTLTKEWDGKSIPALVGNSLGMDKVQVECRRNGIPYLYIDHAYFDRHPQMMNFRLCLSNYHCTDWRDSDKVPRVKIKDWRIGSGRDVVIIHPAEKIKDVYPVQQWLDEAMTTLKDSTDRRIVIKRKGEGALAEVLQNAWAVVCYGSVADVDAVRMGIPAFCGPHSPIYPVAQHDLRLIETPIAFDRAKWLRSLAASEWALDGISQAWERIKCLLPHMQTFKQQ